MIGKGGGAAGAAEQGEEQQLQHRRRDEGGFELLPILTQFWEIMRENIFHLDCQGILEKMDQFKRTIARY